MIGHLPSAELSFDAHGVPYSERYRDGYFSREGGVDETRHVFLAGNELLRRWQSREQFVIGETGFGTGLNFLLTWRTWVEQPGCCRQLHYLAVEKHPLSRSELQQTLSLWPQLAYYAAILLASYPERLAGFHRLRLSQGLWLTLMFGEAAECLAQLSAKVDAWYLDGFAPARNPEMWQPELLRLMASRTAAEGTFSTYSAAGSVRRGLQAVGFTPLKRPGFAGKREMLSGVLTEHPVARAVSQPWLALPEYTPSERRVTILGAGLAGASIAHALAQRGWQVTVLEQRSGPAQEASGNRSGIVLPWMTAAVSKAGRFYLQAYLHSLRLLDELQAEGHDLEWDGRGVLLLAETASQQQRQQCALATSHIPAEVARWVASAQASELAGIALSHGGLYFPGGGCIHPASLCQVLLAEPAINTLYDCQATRLNRLVDGWQVLTEDGTQLAESPVLIMANGINAHRLAVTRWLPLTANRGQTSFVKATSHSQKLRLVLCGSVNLTPAINNHHILGATFSPGNDSTALRASDDDDNLSRLQTMVPELAADFAPGLRSGFAGVRATTTDRLPVVGPVPDYAAFQTDYAELRHGKPARYYPPARHLAGLYLLAGLGARGLIGAPLGAELLASMLNREPLALPREVVDALNPARFIVRDLKRGFTA